jgi:hypothetical protein
MCVTTDVTNQARTIPETAPFLTVFGMLAGVPRKFNACQYCAVGGAPVSCAFVTPKLRQSYAKVPPMFHPVPLNKESKKQRHAPEQDQNRRI